jgi:hypothetical protein
MSKDILLINHIIEQFKIGEADGWDYKDLHFNYNKTTRLYDEIGNRVYSEDEDPDPNMTENNIKMTVTSNWRSFENNESEIVFIIHRFLFGKCKVREYKSKTIVNDNIKYINNEYHIKNIIMPAIIKGNIIRFDEVNMIKDDIEITKILCLKWNHGLFYKFSISERISEIGELDDNDLLGDGIKQYLDILLDIVPDEKYHINNFSKYSIINGYLPVSQVATIVMLYDITNTF